MPRLWSDTVEAHRREVREAILDTAAALVGHHGLRGATMSRIAEQTGIGRATLYKYFPDVEAILAAWHERQVGEHLARLVEIRDRDGDPIDRLTAVLEAYALFAQMSRNGHDGELADRLHRHGAHLEPSMQRVRDLVRALLDEAARAGTVRSDVPSDELASYCLHALGAAAGLRSTAAVRRLVAITLDGLRTDH